MPGLGDLLKGAVSAAKQDGTFGDLATQFANPQGQNESPAALMDSLVSKAKEAAPALAAAAPALAAAAPAGAAASAASAQPITESQALATKALTEAGFTPGDALELATKGTLSSGPGLMQTLAAAAAGGAKRRRRKTFRKRKHAKKTRAKSSATTPRSYRA